jgi:hypothetical protein
MPRYARAIGACDLDFSRTYLVRVAQRCWASDGKRSTDLVRKWRARNL